MARTYEEGKKIGVKDGFRALYCIFRYNAHKAPIPIQFLLYLFIGGLAAVVNLFVFLGMFSAGLSVTISAPTAFITAAFVNYRSVFERLEYTVNGIVNRKYKTGSQLPKSAPRIHERWRIGQKDQAGH